MKKINVALLLSLLLIFSFSSSSFAASTGDILTKAEEGWTRHESSSKEISYYGGNWFTTSTEPRSFNSPWQVAGTGLKFNFEGSKFRLISSSWPTGSKDIDVIVDGVNKGKLSLYSNNGVNAQRIMFEALNLSKGEHSIEFKNNTPEYLFLFAIDTDGPLKPYKPIDSSTPNPNPQPEPTATNRAILTVTMVNGSIKEYDLPMTDVNAFLSWYDTKDSGQGPSRFAVNKYLNNKGPFIKRTDSVIFTSILTFSVDEY